MLWSSNKVKREKVIFLILLIILSINLVKAVSIGIAPTNLEFNIDSDKVCKNVTIKLDSENNERVLIKDKWAGENTTNRDLRKYNLGSINGIDIEYRESITLHNNYNNIVRVCIDSDKGIYKGALLFRLKNHNSGVGTWLLVNSTKNLEKSSIEYINNDIKDNRKLDITILSITPSLFLVLIYILISKKVN